ncbi:hypothetical protein ACYB6S_12470 [Klebsiella pneumoniae]|uniref:hypothetical protein n=1 Tax=Klebsiella pneumoniae TaxID=573 RepID=UPI002499C3E8|nr:hypothetical protein [Klebsiella pneumoniae]MDI2754432.1 hypothetical protein [Klebsiella pneumoniae]
MSKSKVSPQTSFEEMVCGYVMPISDTPDYRSGHWEDIKSMLDEVTISIGFKESRIVSTGLDVSTIHKRIVNNIYNDDIIICDVSSRNPNVMFELGMRIAFDKPVVIIKDNATQYCFDSGTIEHLEYPKDMRYSEIEKFKTLLKQKIENTIEHHKSNPEESPILNSFGSFTAIKPNLPEMSEADLFKSDLQEIKYLLAKSLRNQNDLWNGTTNWMKEQFPKEMFGSTDEEIFTNVTSVPGIKVEGVDDKYVYVLARTAMPLKVLFRKFGTSASQNSLGLND